MDRSQLANIASQAKFLCWPPRCRCRSRLLQQRRDSGMRAGWYHSDALKSRWPRARRQMAIMGRPAASRIASAIQCPRLWVHALLSFLPLSHQCGQHPRRCPIRFPRLQFGRDEIDRAFSQGYAAANPDVVASVTSMD